MTPTEALLAYIHDPSDTNAAVLAKVSPQDIVGLRERHPDQASQDALAPLEHQDYVADAAGGGGADSYASEAGNALGALVAVPASVGYEGLKALSQSGHVGHAIVSALPGPLNVSSARSHASAGNAASAAAGLANALGVDRSKTGEWLLKHSR